MDSNDCDTIKSATIIHFPRRRGRPRSAHRGLDKGTPELVRKRLAGDTAETLDFCLERGFITTHQHWCGIHLRWLYTLRYGAPGIQSIDPTHIKGAELNMDDPRWRAEREKEYNEAIRTITWSGPAMLLMNVCIYNERPRFLSTPLNQVSHESAAMIATLSDGLDVLGRLWNRTK